MRCIEWFRFDTCKYTPQENYQKVWRVRSGRDPSLKQVHRYTNWPQKAPRSLPQHIILVGCMNAHQFDARRRQRRKLNSEHVTCSFSRLEEGTHGSGEERGVRATWPRIWVTKGRDIDKSNSQKIRVDGKEKKTQAWMNSFLHFRCVLIGWVMY